MFYFGLAAVVLAVVLVWESWRRKKKQQPYPILPVLTEWDQKTMAYHEAGHAVCSFFLPEREKLIKITIDPSSEAFGMIQTEARLHHNETRISFCSMISTFLAGRLAEEIFLEVVSTSCIHDFASAQRIAMDMVTKFGMGKNLGFAVLKNTDEILVSEQHSEQICRDVQQILREAEDDARKILEGHRVLVISLAEKLLKQKTLTANEISSFFQYGGLQK